ncbi:MAG TPA: hypothetical protein VD969_12190 [Symbiobacteriaceae bacterium]|nr:hypothetical protein [Symbiobacteriaceae bacterium]
MTTDYLRASQELRQRFQPGLTENPERLTIPFHVVLWLQARELIGELVFRHFGEPIGQDESYYIVEQEPGSKVFLGLKDGTTP